ncbi:hypothetical protein LEMLEM_LOCUS12209, partial [Lemmus lemmus]
MVLTPKPKCLWLSVLSTWKNQVMLWRRPWTTVSASVDVIIETQQPLGTVNDLLTSQKPSREGT